MLSPFSFVTQKQKLNSSTTAKRCIPTIHSNASATIAKALLVNITLTVQVPMMEDNIPQQPVGAPEDYNDEVEDETEEHSGLDESEG